MTVTRTLCALAALSLALTACSGAGATMPTPQTSATPAEATASATPISAATPTPTGPFELALNVADGATKVPVDTLITATPKFGRVDSLEIQSTASGKSTLPKIGAHAADQGVWQADSRLDPGATYTVTATGTGADGTTKTAKAKFTTMSLSRSQEVYPTLTPVQGGPFGVAQPIVIQFDHKVTDKAEFERNLKVTSVPAQEGSWGWIDDKTVHYRPKDHWKPGTDITLDANLNGVNAGNGLYGQESRQLKVKIGREQSAKVDLKAHTLTFTRAGEPPKVWKQTAGKEGFTTRSGMKVIMEKAEGIKMESETTGIARDSAEGYSVKVDYALRVTTSGEFIHSAPWNEGNFGVRNASHGCVGMSDEDAYAFYQASQIGDPVEFVGSDRKLEDDNGWSAWNMSWDQWKAKSALK